MSARVYDVVIAGAGIVGLSAACELARRGARCAIVDKGRPGRQASHAAGGILSPQAETAPGSPLLPLALEARRRHVTLAKDLEERTGVRVEHDTDGVLSLAFSELEFADLERLAGEQRAAGLRAETIARDELLRLEPKIHETTVGASLFPDDHRVDNRRLLEAFEKLASNLGVEIRGGVEVTDLVVERGKVAGVATGAGPILAQNTLNALGAWAGLIRFEGA